MTTSYKAIWIYIALASLIVLFLTLLIKFAINTGFSLPSLEKLVPSFGAILFGIVYLLIQMFSQTSSSENYLDYATIILKDKNRIISPPMFGDSTDPNISDRKFYFTTPIFGLHLNLIYPNGLNAKDMVDFFEYAFLENNPFFSRSGNETLAKHSMEEIIAKNKINAFLNFPLAELQAREEAAKPSYSKANASEFDSLKGINFFLPVDAQMQAKYEDERRTYSIIGKGYQINVILWNGGYSNFRPESSFFHQWIVTRYEPKGSNYEMRKVFITLELIKDKYFNLMDNKNEVIRYYEDLKKNIKLDFSWSPNEDKLKETYRLEVLERMHIKQ